MKRDTQPGIDPPQRNGELRRTVWGAATYLVILLFLFRGLFLGQVLHPGAAALWFPPFSPAMVQGDAIHRVNATQWDVWTQFTIWEEEQRRAARDLELPTWTPRIYGGVPLHANGQSAFLYPFHWPYFLVDPDYARGPMAILRLLVAAIGTFLLLRRFGLNLPACLIGGMVWMLCSFNIRWLLWHHSNSPLWLPVLLLALDAFLDRPTLRRWALASLAFAPLFLAGHPTTQVIVGFVAGLFVATRLVWTAKPAGRALACLGAAVTGGLVAAAALLPFYLNLRTTYEFDHGRGGFTPLPLKALWLFIAPDHYGWSRSVFTYIGPVNYVELACWFGLPALALALGAAATSFLRGTREEPGVDAAKRRALIIFALVLAAVALPLAFAFPPVVHLVEALPKDGRFASWIRMFLGVQFAGAILAAVGAHRVLTGKGRTGIVAAALLLAGTIAVVLLLGADHHRLNAEVLELPMPLLLWNPSLRTAVVALLGLASCLVLAGIARVTRQGAPAGRGWSILLVAVVAADLVWVALDFNPTAPLAMAEPAPPPIVSTMREVADDGRIAGVSRALQPNLAMRYGLRDVRGYDLPKERRLHRVLGAVGLGGSSRTLIPESLVFPEMEPRLASWLDRFSTRCMLARNDAAALRIAWEGPEDRAPADWPRVGLARTKDSLYRNPNAYPRVYMPRRVVTGSAEEAFGALVDPMQDLRELTICETPGDDDARIDVADAEGQVTVVGETDRQVTLDCTTATGGVVVLTDRAAPGWRVTVNGEPARPLTASYLFRAVEVPPGRHEIRWTYRAPGLRAGAWISVLTLVALAGIVAGSYIGRRGW